GMSSGGLPAANAAMPQNMLNSVSAALGGGGFGGASAEQQGIPPAGGGSDQAIPPAATQAGVGQPGQPGQAPGQPGQAQPGQGPAPIPPIQWTSGGGYLSAVVPNADESLASA